MECQPLDLQPAAKSCSRLCEIPFTAEKSEETCSFRRLDQGREAMLMSSWSQSLVENGCHHSKEIGSRLHHIVSLGVELTGNNQSREQPEADGLRN